MNLVRIHSLLDAKEAGLALELKGGSEGIDRPISGPRVQKPGLALAGYTSYVHKERLQVLGLTEMSYVRTLPEPERAPAFERLTSLEVSAIVVTRGLDVPNELIESANRYHVPVFSTPLLSSVFINRVTKWLEDYLAPMETIHGVLMDVFGIGILIMGKSGVGKSEAALDLVLRGHRLVADDIVEVRKRPPDVLYGSGSEIIKHHMEIRGLGIINIKDLFGISAVRDAKRVELVVELIEWDEEEEYDRLGVDDLRHSVLDVAVPMVRVPIRPGRPISSIIEVAARNQLLKVQGKHSAREFQDRLQRALADATPESQIHVDEVE